MTGRTNGCRLDRSNLQVLHLSHPAHGLTCLQLVVFEPGSPPSLCSDDGRCFVEFNYDARQMPLHEIRAERLLEYLAAG